MDKSDLLRRLVVGSLSLALLVVVIILTQYTWFAPIFAALLALVTAVALWEYYQLPEKRGLRPSVWLGLGGAVFYLAIHWLETMGWLGVGSSPLAFAIAAFVLFCTSLFRLEGAIGTVGLSIFGLLYVAVPMALFLDIIFIYKSWWWFFFVVGTTVITDMGGYFVGRYFGKHRLAPTVSPSKTWEGAAGGIVGGVVFAIIWAIFGGPAFWQVVVLGAILSVVGQIGDLAESAFKRDAGVKDSNAIPGLGGMLDVVDSLLFNLPVVYIFLRATA